MSYEFSLGESVLGLQTLEEIGVIWPAQEFVPASEEVSRPDGGIVLVGWVHCSWHWDFLPIAQVNILKALTTGQSTPLYLRTLDDENEWQNYLGQMIWPAKINYQNNKAMDFTLRFRALILQS